MALDLKHTYASELEGAYVPVEPRGFEAPELLTYNDTLHTELGLPDVVRERAAELLSGSWVPAGARPLAMAYAGHQFGGFTPQLGDGRAVLVGELAASDGTLVDLHLKGSGPTPFSRGGDGFASVGPILREHLVSEAMHHLGIPTTRVLGTVKTGRAIYRQSGKEPGAVLGRVASSHLRIGTFEFFAARRGGAAMVERLVDFALERHGGPDDAVPARALFNAVLERQARLMARWMSVGFVHGVMNTDNSTISGETIDYGPCAFLDAYAAHTVFSSIDHMHRYAFGNQPRIAQWNLARLAEALLPLLDPSEEAAVVWAQEGLGRFLQRYEHHWLEQSRLKLGLSSERDGDGELMTSLLEAMEAASLDFTQTFRDLSASLRSGVAPAGLEDWWPTWRDRLGATDVAATAARMDAVNPVYIPRNHLVEEALTAAVQGDLEPFHRLMTVLERPFEVQEGAERYAEPAPVDAAPYVTFCGT